MGYAKNKIRDTNFRRAESNRACSDCRGEDGNTQRRHEIRDNYAKKIVFRISYFVFVIATVMMNTSCLDKLPTNSILDSRAMVTLSDAEQIVNGIYAGFKNPALYSGTLTLAPDIQCDMVYGVNGSTNTYGNFWRWELLANDQDLEAVYQQLYATISRCNFFFAYVERVRSGLIEESDMDALEQLEGDVYFARALAYSELVKMFCKAYDPNTAATDLGVVLVDDYYNPGTPKRSSLRDTYQFILDDLAMAEQYVVRKPTEYVSLFTHVVVDALYARTYLYMQDWVRAEEYASKIIDNKNGTSGTKYPTLSRANVASSADSSISEYEAIWQYDQGSDIIWRVGFTPTSVGGKLGEVFAGYNWAYFRPDYVVGEKAYALYVSNDLRRGILFATANDLSSLGRIGYSYTLTQPLVVKYLGSMEFWSLRMQHISMPKPFRMSEIYLIRAEARCRQAKYGQAGADISALRAARFADGGGAISLGADTWLDRISDERVRELFMEGHRLHDLKRWGRGFERTPQTNSITSGNSIKIAAGDPRFVWPIPQHELDAPGSQVVQNQY